MRKHWWPPKEWRGITYVVLAVSLLLTGIVTFRMPTRFASKPTGYFISAIKQKLWNHLIILVLYAKRAVSPPNIQANHLSPFEYIAHAGGGFNGMVYTDSLEALNHNYSKGFRVFEVDILSTADNKLALVHSWDDIAHLTKAKSQPYSLEVLKSMGRKVGLTFLSFEELASWMEVHPDTLIVLDIKIGQPHILPTLRKIAARYPHLTKRMIPEFFVLTDCFAIKELGFPNIFLSLYVMDYPTVTVTQAAQICDVYAVASGIGRKDLTASLKEQGIRHYVFTVNDKNQQATLYDMGVTGVYTDFLDPGQFNQTKTRLD